MFRNIVTARSCDNIVISINVINENVTKKKKRKNVSVFRFECVKARNVIVYIFM